MAVDRQVLVRAIVGVLRGATTPLKAKRIVDELAGFNEIRGVTASDVNRILYSDLDGKAVKHPDHTWSWVSADSSKHAIDGAGNGHATIPACPACEAPMKRRRARRGPNAGGSFWGCSRYPKCRGTRDCESSEPTATPLRQTTTERAKGSKYKEPRPVVLGNPVPNRQVVSVQCTAAPRALVEAVAFGAPSEAHFRAYTQWRMDVPERGVTPSNPEVDAAIAVVKKLAMRGRLLPLSPDLESRLARLAGINGPLDPERLREAALPVATGARAGQPPVWTFDSSEEEELYEFCRASRGSCSRGHPWLTGQVAIGTLTGDLAGSASLQRVDFVLAHPEMQPLVIEVDGRQHEEEKAADGRRDELLRAAGYQVIRVPASSVARGAGEDLSEFADVLRSVKTPVFDVGDEYQQLLALARRASQIQLTLVHAIVQGIVGSPQGDELDVAIKLPPEELRDEIDDAFVKATLEDLNAFFKDIFTLYGVESHLPRFRRSIEGIASLLIDFTGEACEDDDTTIRIADTYLPMEFVSTGSSAGTIARPDLNSDRQVVRRLLRRLFGFEDFREGQYEGIARALTGRDSVVLLPTGAGKSIIFQMASLLRPGICVGVDPIVSLIDDQIANLRLHGIDRTVQVTARTDPEERDRLLTSMGRGEYLFCYVAPERFQSEQFRNTLRQLTVHTPVALIAIDEAHCVSEWGHDFRPAYLNLARTSREFCRSASGIPPLMGLTGTASRSVLKDVQRELAIDDFEAIITPGTFDRPELDYRVIPCRSDEKLHRLRGVLHDLPRQFRDTPERFFSPRAAASRAGVIFCPHVNADYGVVRVANELTEELNQTVPYYSGSTPKRHDERAWGAAKQRIAMDFKLNRFTLMACTNAFGMGIDKPNIRYTVHYAIPPSIESFYQEAGRAGRDGSRAVCTILFSDDYPARTDQLLSPATPIEDVHRCMEAVTWGNADDVTRSLFFHTRSYQGPEADLRAFRNLLEKIGDLDSPRVVVVDFDPADKLEVERPIYRLVTIGVVEDYTIDHRKNEITLRLSGRDKAGILDHLHRYLAAYQRRQAEVAVTRLQRQMTEPYGQWVRTVGEALIQFIYEVIERSRRQALREVVATCRTCQSPEAFRERILAYLGSSAFSGLIDQVLEADDGGLAASLNVAEEIRSTVDAVHVRGETGRALEAYPDHPGLRLLRAVAEGLVANPVVEDIRENTAAAVHFAYEKYDLPSELVNQTLTDSIRIVCDAHRLQYAEQMVLTFLSASPDPIPASRRAIAALPETLIHPALASLLRHRTESLRILLREMSHE